MGSGKIAGIICSGPSAGAYVARPVAYDWVIGVNRMASIVPCDYWCFNDHEAFGWWPVSREPKPVICTSNQSAALIEKSGADRETIDSYRWLFYPALQTTCPSDADWTGYSMLIAMVLAEHLGAERIVIHGCDWRGNDDFDGTPPPRGTRIEYRWKNEIHHFGQVCRWLDGRGVEVERAGYSKRELRMPGTNEETKTKGGKEKAAAAAEKARTVTVSMVARRDIGIDGATIPSGSALAEVKMLRPEIGINFLTRGHCDGIVGVAK